MDEKVSSSSEGDEGEKIDKTGGNEEAEISFKNKRLSVSYAEEIPTIGEFFALVNKAQGLLLF